MLPDIVARIDKFTCYWYRCQHSDSPCVTWSSMHRKPYMYRLRSFAPIRNLRPSLDDFQYMILLIVCMSSAGDSPSMLTAGNLEKNFCGELNFLQVARFSILSLYIGYAFNIMRATALAKNIRLCPNTMNPLTSASMICFGSP